MKTNWKPIVDANLQECNYASHNDGDTKIFFKRTGDNAWICTHGGWTLSSSMFLSNVSDVILLGGCDLLNLSGYFCVCKKGANYGLKYLGETLPEDCGLDFVENHIEYISNLVGGRK